MQEIKHKLIYIIGYGRSGTTLLDRILNTSDYIFGMGEIAHIVKTLDNSFNGVCGCGLRHDECKVWGNVIADLKSHYPSSSNTDDIYKKFKIIQGREGLFSTITQKDLEFYRNFHRLLFNATYQYSTGDVKYLVDSSKTAWDFYNRPKELNILYKDEIFLFHIIRDGRATGWSNVKNRKGEDNRNNFLKRLFVFSKTIISWNFSKLIALKYRNKNYMKIDYDELSAYPNKVIDELNKKLSINNITLNKINESNHLFAGNRQRIAQIKKIHKDDEWEQKITFLEKLIYCILRFPFNIIKKFI